MFFIFYMYFLLSNSIYSFQKIDFYIKNKFDIYMHNENQIQTNNIVLHNEKPYEMKSIDILHYLTTFKDYTIFSIGEKNREFEFYMTQHNINVYYVNLNNLLDKKEIISILQKKYKTVNSGESLWLFHKGFFIGSTEEIELIIQRKKKNSY